MMRTLLRWTFRLVFSLVALVVLVVGVLLLSLDSGPLRSYLREPLEKVLSSALDADVSIGRISRLGLRGITVEQVSVLDQGNPLLDAKSLDVAIVVHGLANLLPPRIDLRLTANDPDVSLVREPDGQWNVLRLFASESGEPEETDTSLLPSYLAQIQIALSGGVVQVSGLDAPVRLSNLDTEVVLDSPLIGAGTVSIEKLAVRAGEASELRVQGSLEIGGDDELEARVELAPLAARDVTGLVPSLRPDAEMSGSISLAGTLAKPEVELDVTSGAAVLKANALYESPANGSAGKLRASFRTESLNPSLLVVDAPEADLRGEGEVELVPGEELPAELSARIALDQSEILGVALEKLQANAHREGDELVVQLDAATPAEGVRAILDGKVGVAAPYPISAQADVALTDPAALPAAIRDELVGTQLAGRIVVEATDPIAPRPTGRVDLTLDPGRLRGLAFRGAELRASADPKLVNVERISFEAGQSKLEGSGRVELVGEQPQWPVRGSISGPIDLALLPDSRGLLDLDVALSGRVGALDANVEATSAAGKVWLPGLVGTLDAKAEARALGSSAPSANAQVTARVTPLEGLARLIGDEELPSRIAVIWNRTEQSKGPLDRAGLSAVMGTDEKREQRLEVQLERSIETTTIQLGDLVLKPLVGPAWVLDEPSTIVMTPDEIAVRELRLDAGRTQIEVDGKLANKPALRSDLRLNIRDLQLAPLCNLALAWEGCEGQLEARFQVQGTAARPDLNLDVGIHNLEIGDQRYDEARITGRTPTAGQFSIQGSIAGKGGRLGLDASIPLETGQIPAPSMTRPARVDVQLRDFEVDALRAATGPAVSQLDGQANGDVMMRGSLDEPDLSGSIQISDLTIGVEAAGGAHKNGKVQVAFTRDNIDLVELDLDNGTITAGGTVDLAGNAPTRLDLWVELAQARVLDRAEASADMSGRITLAGEMDAPRLEGDVTINPATIRPTLKSSGGPPIDPTIQVVLKPDPKELPWVSGIPPEMAGPIAPPPIVGEEKEVTHVAPSGFYETLSMNLTAKLGDAVVVSRFDAYLRLSGQVYVTKAPSDQIRITGEIDGRNGWYIFQGRRLEINDAYVTFSGETPIDPYLKVEATYRAPEYLITARINGTAQQPSLDLSSDPPLDQSDILAVLLFGKPASDLSSGQSQVLQQQAIGLLASYIAPELQNSILDTFGLTSLTFSMPTGDTAGTVGVGRYIGQDLFVSVAQDFGGPKGGTERQLQGLVGSSVTIQYYVTPSITLQGASSTQGESSVDAIWHRRY